MMKAYLDPLLDIFRLPAFDSPEMKADYWAREDRSKYAHRKYFLIIAIVTFASIGMLDRVIAGDAAGEMLAIRLATIAILAVIYFRFTGKCSAEQRDRELFVFGITVGISLTVMSLLAPRPAADFYPFLIPATMVFGSALVVPRFSTLARLCICANLIYWPTVPFSQTSMPAIYATIFVMAVTTFSVVVGAFSREKLEREQALYQAQLADAREEAISARDTAIQANHAKSHLLANVSHELRTPMNAILGFSEVMKTEIFGRIEQEQYREYVSDIHFAGTLLQANINDLLDVSRLEVGKMSWSDSWAGLTEIIDRTLATCAPDAEASEIELTQDVDDGNIQIFCDPERTAQILINLVTNAIKFSDAKTRITISSRIDRDATTLSVTDQGCGIKAEHIEQIVEPFRQLDSNSMTTQKGGMGLGLSIVKDLVKKLDGELLIESELGQGTTASVKIPAARIAGTDTSAPRQSNDISQTVEHLRTANAV